MHADKFSPRRDNTSGFKNTVQIDLLKEFEPRSLYLYLEEKYKDSLIYESINRVGSQSILARRLRNLIKCSIIKQSHISDWIKKKTLRLDIIDGLCHILNTKLDRSKIKGIKGQSTTQLIRYPNLHISSTPELASLLANLYCDGCIEFRNGFVTQYTNKCNELHEEFKWNFIKTFGYIEFSEHIDHVKEIKVIRIPCFIGKFLYKKFDIYSNRIPNLIKKSPKNIKAAYLRSVFDDEGSIHINSGQIRLKMKYRSYVKDVKNFLERDFNIRCSQIIKEIRLNYRCYYFLISGGPNLKRFYHNIGLIHPEKRYKLLRRITTVRDTYGYQAKEKVHHMLKIYGPKTVGQLAFILNRDKRTINYHLSNLKKQRRVDYKKLKRKFVYEYLWYCRK